MRAVALARTAPPEHAPEPIPEPFRDPLEQEVGGGRPRQRYVLEDTGFREVPKKFRRFYRAWRGVGDHLAPNEVLCPVCKVVIRSTRELRPGDRVYCMPCMSRLTVVQGGASLEAVTVF